MSMKATEDRVVTNVNLPRAVRSQIIFAYFGPDLSDCGRLPRFSFGGGVWALGEQSA